MTRLLLTWLMIIESILLGCCIGYTVQKRIDYDTGIKVVELDRRTAANLIRNVRCER